MRMHPVEALLLAFLTWLLAGFVFLRSL